MVLQISILNITSDSQCIASTYQFKVFLETFQLATSHGVHIIQGVILWLSYTIYFTERYAKADDL